jgi:hypothetical protein
LNFKELLEDPKLKSKLSDLFSLDFIEDSVYINYFINNDKSKKLNKIIKIIIITPELVIEIIRILSLESDNFS